MIIQLTESEFFVENKQEPIARKFEILFHNVLFLGITIELFGLAFLISKLIFLPIARFIYNYFIKYCFHFKIIITEKFNRKTNAQKQIETTQV